MTEKSSTRFSEMPPLDYGAIKKEVHNLPEAIYNKLDREWPSHWPQEQGPKDLLRGLVRSSEFTFRAALHLVSEDKDPSRRPEFAIALPPLVRSLLDTLATLVLLFDDFPANSRRYFRAGWRELAETRERIAELYPDDAIWTEWLEETAPMLEQMRKDFGISMADAAARKKALPYWPSPPQIPTTKGVSKDRAEFIEYLLGAYYRDLSQDAHMSWPGFLRRAAPLLHPNAENLENLKQGWFQIALILLLAILTEIDSEGGLGLRDRLAFLWVLLIGYNSFAESIYERRYVDLLA